MSHIDDDISDEEGEARASNQDIYTSESVCGRQERSSVFGGPSAKELQEQHSPAMWYHERSQMAARRMRTKLIALPLERPDNAHVGPGDYTVDGMLSFPSHSYRSNLRTQARSRLHKGVRLPPVNLSGEAAGLRPPTDPRPGPGEYSLPEQRTTVGVRFGSSDSNDRAPVLLLKWMH